MARLIINTGTNELSGDGESIRSAFNKINSNFYELYTTGGPIGYTGSAMVGYTGSTIVGYTGSGGGGGGSGDGYTGSRGFIGSQGIIGFTGSIGFQGSQGAGFTGSSAAGFTGSAGFGFTGSAVVGFTGSAGTGGGGGNVYNLNSTTDVTITSNNNTWTFLTNGDLSVPAGGILTAENENFTITANSTVTPVTYVFNIDGKIEIPSDLGVLFPGLSTLGSFIDLDVNGATWTFDTSGSLFWPNGSEQTTAYVENTFVTVSSSTSALSSGTTGTITISGPTVGKAYVLYKLETSNPAWIRLYTNSSNRSADTTRSITVDPASDSGVIVEVISTVSGTTVLTPGINGFNDDPGGPTNTMYFNITNLANSTATITITATTVILVK